MTSDQNSQSSSLPDVLVSVSIHYWYRLAFVTKNMLQKLARMQGKNNNNVKGKRDERRSYNNF